MQRASVALWAAAAVLVARSAAAIARWGAFMLVLRESLPPLAGRARLRLPRSACSFGPCRLRGLQTVEPPHPALSPPGRGLRTRQRLAAAAAQIRGLPE